MFSTWGGFFVRFRDHGFWVRVGRQGTKKTGRNGETNKKMKESAMEAKLTKYERVPEEEIEGKPAPVHEQQ